MLRIGLSVQSKQGYCVAKSIELAIPARSKKGKNAFSIHPKKLDNWLDNLPRANLGETSRQLYDALVSVNQTQYSYHDRLRFLESMREPVQYITDSLKKHFIGVSYPLPSKNQKIAAVSREILMAMATGYKIAINDLLSRSILFYDKKLLTTLLHRAIVYTGRSLLTSYQIYAPYPPKLWKELHKLYKIAEEKKLENQQVADYQLLFVKRSSLQAEYTRILLLSLSSPYRLRQGEANKVYQSLERWTQYCQFGHIDPQLTLDESYFAVLLNRDRPPRSLGLMSLQNTDLSECRMINTAALADVLRLEIQQSTEMGQTTLRGVTLAQPELSHDLLRRLLLSWAVTSKRHFSRSQKQEQVDISIGLSNIHKYIQQGNGDQPQQNFAHNRAHFTSIERPQPLKEHPDIWNMVYPQDIQGFTPLQESGWAPTESAPSLPQDEPELENNWVIVNESAGGYCLEYTRDETAHVQVGELVGIRRYQHRQSNEWGVGVIRWMKFSSTRTLRIGIEMVNPRVAAIGIRAPGQQNLAGKEMPYQRCLMLPEIPAIHQPASLITPPSPWRTGQYASINLLGKERHIQLTDVQHTTGLFTQFQFAVLNSHTGENSHSEHGRWEIDKDFTKIWTSM